jgi:hypothetical protein
VLALSGANWVTLMAGCVPLVLGAIAVRVYRWIKTKRDSRVGEDSDMHKMMALVLGIKPDPPMPGVDGFVTTVPALRSDVNRHDEQIRTLEHGQKMLLDRTAILTPNGGSSLPDKVDLILQHLERGAT